MEKMHTSLPDEMIASGEYDKNTGNVVFTRINGETITIALRDIIKSVEPISKQKGAE